MIGIVAYTAGLRWSRECKTKRPHLQKYRRGRTRVAKGEIFIVPRRIQGYRRRRKRRTTGAENYYGKTAFRVNCSLTVKARRESGRLVVCGTRVNCTRTFLCNKRKFYDDDRAIRNYLSATLGRLRVEFRKEWKGRKPG